MKTPPPHPTDRPTEQLGPSGGPKKPQGAPGARNVQVANRSVIEKYHFGDRRPKPDLGAIWGPKTAQAAPGARNAKFANSSVIEKYHFGDRHPKPDLGAIWGPKQGAPGRPEMLRLLIAV